MKVSNTSERLQKLLRERGLRQADVLEMAAPVARKYNDTLTKSNLSFYVTGRGIPAQNKLVILAETLNVSEAWLMGYDVPMDREPLPSPDYMVKVDDQEILLEVKKLDEQQKALLRDYLSLLLKSKR